MSTESTELAAVNEFVAQKIREILDPVIDTLRSETTDAVGRIYHEMDALNASHETKHEIVIANHTSMVSKMNLILKKLEKIVNCSMFSSDVFFSSNIFCSKIVRTISSPVTKLF